MGYYPHWEWDAKLRFDSTEKATASVAVNNIFDECEYGGDAVTAGATVYGEIRFEM